MKQLGLAKRDEMIPTPTSTLSLGDMPIAFEIPPADGGKALNRVVTKVARIERPF